MRKFTPEQNEFRKPIEVSRIHFLIHPGYMSLPETREEFVNEPKAIEEYKELFDKYFKKARSLANNELMFVFMPLTITDLKQNKKINDFIYIKLSELKDILQQRGIFLTDHVNKTIVTGDPEEYYEKDQGEKILHKQFSDMMRVAKARGYTLTPEVESEAYGEMLSTCVDIGASNIQSKLGLIKPTTIRTALTDMGLPISEKKHELIKRIAKRSGSDAKSINYDKLTYDISGPDTDEDKNRLLEN